MNDLLTLREAASLMRTSYRHARALVMNRKLPAVDVGLGTHREWRIRRADLETFLTPQQSAPAAPPVATKPYRPRIVKV